MIDAERKLSSRIAIESNNVYMRRILEIRLFIITIQYQITNLTLCIRHAVFDILSQDPLYDNYFMNRLEASSKIGF